MSLHIVYGRAGSGKSRWLINEIAGCIKHEKEYNGEPLILIVPEQFTVQSEKRLLSVVPRGAIINADVVSFRRMAQRVLAQTGGGLQKPIDNAGRRMILHKAIEECRGKLRYFSKASDQPGFLTQIITLLDEFGRYNFDPERMGQAIDAVGTGSGLHEKLSELHMICSRYNEILHEKYIDQSDILDMLAKNIDDYSDIKGARIWIDEFSGFTPQEYRIIEKLLRHARKVTVALCCEEPGYDMGPENIFHGVHRTFFKLIGMARENGVTVEESTRLTAKVLPRFQKSSALAHLEREFFSLPGKVFTGGGTKDAGNSGDGGALSDPYGSGLDRQIGIYAGKDFYSEVEYVACKIIELCREQGYRYRDIAVVARNLETYENAIKITFKKYDIPFFMDMKKDLMEHPLTRLIMAALEAISDNFSYHSVFKYVKTGLLNYDRNLLDIIENYVLARNIRGRRWFEDEFWNLEDDPDFDFIPREHWPLINAERLKLVTPLAGLREEMSRDRTVRGFCSALYNFLISLGIPEIIEQKVEEYKKRSEFTLASEYTQIWNIIMNVLDQMVQTLGDFKTSSEKFSGLMEAGFSDYKIGFIPSTLDCVQVGSVDRSRVNEIKALFVLGVNSGIFPAAGVKEGILTDMDRNMLKEAGFELAPDSREQAFAEQFLVYSVLTAPSEFLHLSYAAKDMKSQGLNPSEIIGTVRRIFPKVLTKTDVFAGEAFVRPLERICRVRPAFGTMLEVAGELDKGDKSRVVGLMNIIGDTGYRDIWEKVYKWMEKRAGLEECDGSAGAETSAENHSEIENAGQSAGGSETVREMMARAEDFYRKNKYRVPYIHPEKAAALFGKNIYTSISRIERFYLCPYAFFAEYGLKATERKILKLAMPDIGTFVHAIVEEFSNEMSRKNIPWSLCSSLSESGGIVRDSEGNVLIDSGEIIERVLSSTKSRIFSDSKRYRFLSYRLGRMVNRSIEAMAFQISSGDFKPFKFEAAFGTGEEGSYPALSIYDENNTKVAQLTGRIDRIDLYEKDGVRYYRVVDYKSGGKEFKLADIFYGLSIQLVSYLAAIRESDPAASPAGCFYFNMSDFFNRTDRNAVPGEIRHQRLKEYKMRGLVLNDPEIVAAMDKNIDGHSLVIPAQVLKDGTIKGSIATGDGFDKLTSLAMKNVRSAVDKISSGFIRPYPAKKKQFTACSYCKYAALCGFDRTGRSGYRFLPELKDQDVWKRM